MQPDWQMLGKDIFKHINGQSVCRKLPDALCAVDPEASPLADQTQDSVSKDRSRSLTCTH